MHTGSINQFKSHITRPTFCSIHNSHANTHDANNGHWKTQRNFAENKHRKIDKYSLLATRTLRPNGNQGTEKWPRFAFNRIQCGMKMIILIRMIAAIYLQIWIFPFFSIFHCVRPRTLCPGYVRTVTFLSRFAFDFSRRLRRLFFFSWYWHKIVSFHFIHMQTDVSKLDHKTSVNSQNSKIHFLRKLSTRNTPKKNYEKRSPSTSSTGIQYIFRV